MCCCITSEPTEDVKGRIRVFRGTNRFQAATLTAPLEDCISFLWFLGQCFPLTSGCAQYFLRYNALGGDLTKYSCFQGYFNGFCCISAGSCGEQNCPQLCLFAESCCCNCIAISATRMYIMEKYDLQSDPCDYRLIRINNCLQLFSFVCNLLAICFDRLRELARLIDCIADLFYHCLSGCFTAQVAYEIKMRDVSKEPDVVVAEPQYTIASEPKSYEKTLI